MPSPRSVTRLRQRDPGGGETADDAVLAGDRRYAALAMPLETDLEITGVLAAALDRGLEDCGERQAGCGEVH